MIGRVFCELFYSGKKMSEEFIADLIFMVVWIVLNLGFDVEPGRRITYTLAWIGFFFLVCLYAPQLLWGTSQGMELIGARPAQVFFYVPRKGGGLRAYLKMRVWIMSIFYLLMGVIFSLVSNLITYAVYKQFPRYMVGAQDLLSVAAFVTLMLRIQLAGLSRYMLGTAFSEQNRLLRFFHNVMITLNVAALLLSCGEIELYGETLYKVRVDEYIVLLLVLAGAAHIAWYFRYILDEIAGKKERTGKKGSEV